MAFPIYNKVHLLYASEIDIGLRVLLANPNKEYDIGRTNPAVGTEFECEGTVYDIDPIGEEDEENDYEEYDENACIYVKWDNGSDNVYKSQELIASEAGGQCVSIWRNWRI